ERATRSDRGTAPAGRADARKPPVQGRSAPTVAVAPHRAPAAQRRRPRAPRIRGAGLRDDGARAARHGCERAPRRWGIRGAALGRGPGLEGLRDRVVAPAPAGSSGPGEEGPGRVSAGVTREELQAQASRAVFARDYGFRVRSFGDGVCSVEVPFHVGLERPGGLVGGPVFMAAADVTMWLAILTRLGVADGSVTASLTTSFLGAARGEG